MRELKVETSVSASAERIRRVLEDVERWPEWTSSVLCIEVLSELPLDIGSPVRIHQPKLRPAIWKVTRWGLRRRFTWEAEHPGITVVADHAITSYPSDCTVRLSVQFNGMLGSLVGALSRGLTARYLALEASGLKARSEFKAARDQGHGRSV